MKTCSRCVLTEKFPGIQFDEQGVCNYCLNTPIPSPAEKDEHLQKFEALLAEKKDKHCFDVLLAFSGGKDSTYTLRMLTLKYKLKVLAFTFDNGFEIGRAHV